MIDTVIIVPGNLASSLSDIGSNPKHIWINPIALAFGAFQELKLAKYDGPDGEKDAMEGVNIMPFGFIPVLYEKLASDLVDLGFLITRFAYDWRKDIDSRLVASGLSELIYQKMTKGIVHVIAHSEGGMVVRRALQILRNQNQVDFSNLGKVILLAPAISGTFAAALGISGSSDEIPFPFNIIKSSPARLQPVLSTFTSLYQLLPWNPSLFPSLNENNHDVVLISFWKGKADINRLSRAFPDVGPMYAESIDTTFFNDKMSIILGDTLDDSTSGGVHWVNGALVTDHQFDLPGDGLMAHRASVLPQIPAYIDPGIGHVDLPRSGNTIKAIADIIDEKIPDSVKQLS